MSDEQMYKYKCIGKNLVVRADPPVEEEKGIFIPEVAQKRPKRGTVIAVGTGVEYQNGTIRPLHVKVGDRILYGEYAGVAIEVDGEELLYMREDEVVLIEKKEA